MEESTYFNGQMNVPVKTYNLYYTLNQSKIILIAEYRRNTWKNANWYKNIQSTDIYLWTLKLESSEETPDFRISRNNWLQTYILKRPNLKIKSQDNELKYRLEKLNNLKDLFKKIDATIRVDDQNIWTSFNTLIDHKKTINKALTVFEEIENEIQSTPKKS